MASCPFEDYPRPDFYQTRLTWASLDGPWDFLFDDEDIGLASRWHRKGLPQSVIVQDSDDRQQASHTESESMTARITGNTQKLAEGNLAHRKANAQKNHRRTINVPYVFQSPASGINERAVHEVLWYERKFKDIRPYKEKMQGDRLLVRFGAVDYDATIWVNGQYVGGHRGGHVPFDIDITDAIEEQNRVEHRLTVRVYDSAYDLTQPRGKQYWGAKPESIFYTPSSGIWQSVWLESVPSTRIANSSHGTVLRSDDIHTGILHARVAVLGRRVGTQYSVEIEAKYLDDKISTSERKSLPKDVDNVGVDISLRLKHHQKSYADTWERHLYPERRSSGWHNDVAIWAPDFPRLYDLSIRLFDSAGDIVDEVKTTTGMRSISWEDNTFKLNGTPLFQTLCLDQGYWPETFMTPPSSTALREDISMAKRMGFNGCRKHQKVEDPRFLYHADRMGYLVWGEMANAYRFSEEYVERFNEEWIEAVKRDINHPCVVTWTPVNESWAYTDLKESVEQRNHIRSLYYMTKTLDQTRPINDNCGWEHVITDLDTFHDYADAPALAETCKSITGIHSPKAGRPTHVGPISKEDSNTQVRRTIDEGAACKPDAPIICTEFGGVNIAPATGQDQSNEWGYTTAADPEDLLNRIERLVNAVVDGSHCCGFVWTQLADIEQETNGLYSFDRQAKIDAKKVKAVMDAAHAKYHARISDGAQSGQGAETVGGDQMVCD